MYIEAASANITSQGKAVRRASRIFGNGGKTLSITPCKKGYIPIVKGQKMYGCRLHSNARRKRLELIGYNEDEARLEDFWSTNDRKESKVL